MKTEIKIENCLSPFCVIHTKEKTTAIENLASKIAQLDETGKSTVIPAWDGDYCLNLKLSQILRIYSQDKKVFVQAQTEDKSGVKNEDLLLKQRLYQFEETANSLGCTNFVRISNTDIVNIDFIEKFDLTFSGVIKIIMKNGTVAIVSRRYMPKIKNQITMTKGALGGQNV